MAHRTHTLIGSSETARRFREQVEKAAASDATVLFVGESGAGKALAARALHEASARRAAPFVVADIAAVPPTLAEAALFGHERGAFTDAHRAREGLFRRAEGGTLVLDDVDLLDKGVQAKLLRVLQEGVVEPVGAERPVEVDVRVVATTNRDLEAEVEADRFRADLYWRLAVVPLALPPLRARPEDVEELARHLLAGAAARLGTAERELSSGALERLRAHPWPGNVRELENALERVLVLGAAAGAAPIEAGELDFLAEGRAGVPEELARQALAHGLTVDELTGAMLDEALAEQRGNVSAAARRVGLTRRAFDYRLAQRSGDRKNGAEPAEAGEEAR